MYLTRDFTDAANGFVATHRIFNDTHDVNGFIGYMPSDKTIYVVFRGSQSFENFVDDMNIHQEIYHADVCPGQCTAHKGFFAATQSVNEAVIAEVKNLLVARSAWSIVVTGHSLGAALATFMAVEISIRLNLTNLRLFTYGSPRLGNLNTATFISGLLGDRNRITHRKDIVPHMPLFAEHFTHISGEWYEDEAGLHACEGFEDPYCSFQFYFPSISDHMWYLGTQMGIFGCTLDDLDTVSRNVMEPGEEPSSQNPE